MGQPPAVALEDLFEPTWATLERGAAVSVVVSDVIWDTNALMGRTVPHNKVIRINGTLPTETAGFPCLTFLQAKFERFSGLVELSVDSGTCVLPHRPILRDDVLNYVELCSGMSTSSFGFCHVGFRHKCSVEWQSSLVDLHRRVHPTVPVLHADICARDTAKKIHDVCPDPFMLMSGFSCQPYSRGGLEKGEHDARSSTLPATLQLLHWLRAPLLVLECVVPASNNCFVMAHVKALETQLGFHVSQCCLRLESVWCGCRYRWWLIAAHPALGRVLIPPFPEASPLTVRDLMPFVKRWPEEVESQLRVSQTECEKFQAHGQHLRQFVVKADQKLPTALRSWGGQVVACACGCRDQGFSDALLVSKGIYAQLLQVTLPDGTVMYRHLHAIEVAILSGVPPCLDWSDNERLNLCAIGQMAAPMQSVWIGASIVRHMQLLFTTDAPLEPNQALHELKLIVHAQSKQFFGDIPKPLDLPSDLDLHRLEVHDQRGHPFLLQCRREATVKDLIFAEADLLHVPVFDLAVCEFGSMKPLDQGTCLGTYKSVVVVFTDVPPAPVQSPMIEGPSLTDMEVDAKVATTMPTQLDPHELVEGHVEYTSSVGSVCPGLDSSAVSLLQLSAKQLRALLPPLVGDASLCRAMRKQSMSVEARIALLDHQHTLWGDDELLWHLTQVTAQPHFQDVTLIDPLLVTSWTQLGNVDLLHSWMHDNQKTTRFVSAVLLEGHWTPFVWTCRNTTLDVVSWEHDDVSIDPFNGLHGLLCQALGLSTFRVACTRRPFGLDLCGAGVVTFIRASLESSVLPCTESALANLDQQFRFAFRNALTVELQTPRPWCWGSGSGDLQTVLATLLQFHGVPPAVSGQRAKLVLQSLGRDPVQGAVNGVSPWKSLKQLANQHKPMVQLVLPDELAAVTQAKKEKGPQRKQKEATKPAPTRPTEVDPCRLVLADQSFCTGDGIGVAQIPLSQVGPLVSGISLVNYVDAVPFLQDNKVLTPKGLALLVINGPDEITTDLTWSTIRFAAKCAANQQPVLLQGFLVQLGQQVIAPNRTLSGPSVPSVPVACARITVFKDQWPHDWESFCEHPVRSLLETLPPLQTCRSENCDCDKWHPITADGPREVLLDVFRRQFFKTDSGRPVKAAQSTHFSVQVRFLKSQELMLLKHSGLQGVFLEPRSMDASMPSDEFQVVWIPQASGAEVQHHAQCEALSIGVARSGRRFGVRVLAKHYQDVFLKIKPEGQFLAPGQRLTWHCGPWPFGSDRKMLGKIFASWNWQARPLQPARTVDGGVMWLVQSVSEPPESVWNMQHGQVMVSRCESASSSLAQSSTVIGSQSTLELCSASSNVDPWLLKDPWSQSVRAVPVNLSPPVTTQLQEMEERIEKSLLDKLPHDKMETDEQETRILALEQQLQHLATRQQSLEGVVHEHHKQNTAQVQGLQTQMVSQMEAQRSQMESLFESQMNRLEAILAKKGRYE